ncbi:MAG: CARDB domain-containing protein [Pyrinomonadaceae bacterium]
MQSTIKILNTVALAASFLSVMASTSVAQVPGANPNKGRPGAITRARPLPPLRPDLVVVIRAPRMANAGDEIGRAISIRARNRGLAAAPGTAGRIAPGDGYMIDVVLSTDALMPEGFANPSANFVEDMLLRGGRISSTADLAPGGIRAYPVGATIPADTPTGWYFLCARIDPGNKVAESNEHNNTACYPIHIRGVN